MQVIYADTVFLTNFIINYFILLATAKICAAPVSRLRLAAAAAIGGAYAVAASLPPLAFLGGPLVIVAAGLSIITAAFGGQRRIARITLVFFAVSASFAGAVLAVSLIGGGGITGGLFTPVSFKVLVLSFAVCYAVVTVVFKRTARDGGGIVGLTVRQGGSELTLRALVDTGNSLRDPITGMPVVVTDVNDAKKLFSRELRDTVGGLGSKGAVTVLEELAGISGAARFQLIPYSAVGVPGGMLLAFRPDEIVVNGAKKKGMLIAISPNSVSDNGTYTALIGA